MMTVTLPFSLGLCCHSCSARGPWDLRTRVSLATGPCSVALALMELGAYKGVMLPKGQCGPFYLEMPVALKEV